MSEQVAEQDEVLLEECIDEIDAAVERLERFPPVVLAFALRAHLAALLHALRASHQIGDDELHEFLSTLQVELAMTPQQTGQ